MLLLIIIVIVELISFVVASKTVYEYGTKGVIGILAAILCIICMVVSFLSLLAIVKTNIDAAGIFTDNQQTYETLMNQLKTGMHDNDCDICKTEFYNKIADYNANLKYNKAMRNNIWIGVFYPDIYDKLEFIELN